MMGPRERSRIPKLDWAERRRRWFERFDAAKANESNDAQTVSSYDSDLDIVTNDEAKDAGQRR